MLEGRRTAGGQPRVISIGFAARREAAIVNRRWIISDDRLLVP